MPSLYIAIRIFGNSIFTTSAKIAHRRDKK
jgi:hypothetical protein